MILGITLDIDGKEQKISLDNARTLYGELNKLFGNNNTNMNHQPRHVEHDGMNNEQPTQRQAPKPKPDAYANPKVEAARDRAAARTSGCGARR